MPMFNRPSEPRVAEVEMHLARDTTNTYRYESVDRAETIPILYVKKAQYGDSEPPRRITVTVREVL